MATRAVPFLSANPESLKNYEVKMFDKLSLSDFIARPGRVGSNQGAPLPRSRSRD